MLVARVIILQGDRIEAEVLVGTAGTRVMTYLRKPSARVLEAIEVIEAEVLMRLREEMGLPSAAEKGKPRMIAACQSFEGGVQCTEPAQWSLGTWQFCDEHARKYLFVSNDLDILDPGVQKRLREDPIFGGSCFGTAARLGQEALLKHCKRYGVNLKEVE